MSKTNRIPIEESYSDDIKFIDINIYKRHMRNLRKRNEDLEERINKAIEYIKYWTQDGGIILSWESVIKILEGEEVE